MEKVIPGSTLLYSQKQREVVKKLSRKMISESRALRILKSMSIFIAISLFVYIVHHQASYGHILHLH